MARLKWLVVFVASFCGVSLSEDFPQISIFERTKRSAPSCGGSLQNTEGSFSLETEECANGTYRCYRKNMECQWDLEAPVGQIVMLRSDDFDLEPSEGCIWDYVEIVEEDGRSTKHCGWYPLLYMSTTNKLTINFKSDVSYEGRGFTFDYFSYVPDYLTRCNTSMVGQGGRGGHVTNVESAGDTCYYSIQAPEGKVVQLNLDTVDFSSSKCREEKLVIRDGATMQGKVLTNVCSGTQAGQLDVGHHSAVFIEYDNTVGAVGKRFTLSFQFVDPPPEKKYKTPVFGGDPDCSHFYKGILKDGVEVYEAPPYESNKHCIVVVRNTLLPNSVVQVTFEKFHVEESENCVYDSLQIKLGERNSSKSLGGPYCGKELQGRTFISFGNSLRLEYKTDESLSWFGVRATISFVERSRCIHSDCANGVCILQDHEKLCIPGNKCRDIVCENGGTCVESQTTSKCYCPTGFSGPRCAKGEGIHLKDPPTNRQEKKGSLALSRCYTGTNEPENVIWLFNGERIGSYDPAVGKGTHEDGGFLQIDDFDRDDEGFYTCIVENSHGSVEHIFELTYVDDCEVVFSSRPKKQITRVGADVLFPCNADHAVSFHWEYAKTAGDRFQNVSGRKFEQQSKTGFLLINDLEPEDAGIYQCVSKDKRGCTSKREAELVILKTKAYNKYCGITRHDEDNIITDKIFKGNTAKPGVNPWHVTLKAQLESTTVAFCGGTLISSNYVLTAAHCIDGFLTMEENKDKTAFSKTSVKLLFGATDCRESRITRAPESHIVHNQYNSVTKDNDIAIIELDSPIEFDDDVRPVCLDTETNVETMFFDSSSKFGKVAGCGRLLQSYRTSLSAKKIQEVHLPYVKRKECKSLFKRWNADHPDKQPVTITNNMICAGFESPGKGDVCRGDSGGALVMDHGYQYYQTGIVSFGPSCGKGGKGTVGVYTDVANYFDWIDQVTGFTRETCDTCDWAS